MNLLLDTHIALWLVTDAMQLSPEARRAIVSAEAVHVSVVSIWELAIKHSTGKFETPAERVRFRFEEAGLLLLPVTPEHAITVDRLPWHHRDPFDRMLVAQALCEPLRLLTHDARLAAYSDTVIVV